ncbi:hypothetical protein [Szabonella alba]|uniref:Uncharacterized protein n=1 Tax=Szabonella alba TaxID=2804194 RepID=A0A8K0V9Z9_9RHOB|nr:hypothetical protein [Szabonella alba]MBL4916378.1 hypothetical protein [Szabonella alba]
MLTERPTTRPGLRLASILREAGFALAALALWMLLLLSPLHQSAQALVTFQIAGALPPGASLLCQPAGGPRAEDRPVLTCPFQGVTATAALPPLAQGLILSRRRCSLLRRARPAPPRPRRARHALPQPRAPPVLI